jgi:hypothetical protein
MSRLSHLGSLPDWGKTSLKIECVVRCSGFKIFQTDLLFRGVKNHDFLPMCSGNDNDLSLVAQLSNRLGNQFQTPDSMMKQKNAKAATSLVKEMEGRPTEANGEDTPLQGVRTKL